MLAGITPLGERSRGRSWPCTVTAFIVGATVGGAIVGALLGLLGASLGLGNVALTTRVLILVAAASLGALADAGRFGLRIPTARRQVNAGWMTAYRGGVYGAGFGFQLGSGFLTVITGSATIICALFAVLTASTTGGLLVFGAFGVVRGLSVLPAGFIRRPHQLVRMSLGLGAWDSRVRRLVSGAQIAITVTLAIIVVT